MENYKISDPVEYQIESRKIFLKKCIYSNNTYNMIPVHKYQILFRYKFLQMLCS